MLLFKRAYRLIGPEKYHCYTELSVKTVGFIADTYPESVFTYIDDDENTWYVNVDDIDVADRDTIVHEYIPDPNILSNIQPVGIDVLSVKHVGYIDAPTSGYRISRVKTELLGGRAIDPEIDVPMQYFYTKKRVNDTDLLLSRTLTNERKLSNDLVMVNGVICNTEIISKNTIGIKGGASVLRYGIHGDCIGILCLPCNVSSRVISLEDALVSYVGSDYDSGILITLPEPISMDEQILTVFGGMLFDDHLVTRVSNTEIAIDISNTHYLDHMESYGYMYPLYDDSNMTTLDVITAVVRSNYSKIVAISTYYLEVLKYPLTGSTTPGSYELCYKPSMPVINHTGQFMCYSVRRLPRSSKYELEGRIKNDWLKSVPYSDQFSEDQQPVTTGRWLGIHIGV